MAYIERESAIKSLLNDYLGQVGYSREDAADCIFWLDTADVAPVRHGRWIEPSRLYYGAKQYECSLCYSDTFWKKHNITVNAWPVKTEAIMTLSLQAIGH